MKEISKILITILLTPLYFATILFKVMFEVIEPLAQDIGNNLTRPFIELYSSMYEHWKKIFKWR